MKVGPPLKVGPFCPEGTTLQRPSISFTGHATARFPGWCMSVALSQEFLIFSSQCFGVLCSFLRPSVGVRSVPDLFP